MKDEWRCKAFDCFMASFILVLIAIAYGGCGPRNLVRDVSVQPTPKVEVGGKLWVSIPIDNPPKGKRLRFVWNAKGKLPGEYQASGEYIAPNEPGLDTIICEVWSEAEHLATRTATVEVLPASTPLPAPESGQLRTQEPPKSASVTPESRPSRQPKLPVPEDKNTSGKPTIRITQIPPYDSIGGPASSANIAGEVEGVEPKKFRVVLYALTDVWYVQPLIAAPFTEISEDGKWATWTHCGTEYAALLVKPSYKPPAQKPTLPAVGGDILAVAREKGR